MGAHQVPNEEETECGELEQPDGGVAEIEPEEFDLICHGSKITL